MLFAQADRIEDGMAIARTFVRAICTSAYEQVQATIRKAADEFLRYTDAGKVLQHNFKNRLTYQEVLCCMPAAWLKKYGLQLIQRNTYSNAVLL